MSEKSAKKSVRYYSDITSCDVDWFWYPYIPYGKITLVQGDPGIGKSSLVHNLLAQASTGEKMPDGKNHPAVVSIYQCLEDTALYYDQDEDEKPTVLVALASLGERRYDPLLIWDMMSQGKSPQEGWGYLSGMAKQEKTRLLLYPRSWSGGLGDDITRVNEKLFRLRSNKTRTTSEPYGWTVGLDLPSEEDIQNQIARLSC